MHNKRPLTTHTHTNAFPWRMREKESETCLFMLHDENNEKWFVVAQQPFLFISKSEQKQITYPLSLSRYIKEKKGEKIKLHKQYVRINSEKFRSFVKWTKTIDSASPWCSSKQYIVVHCNAVQCSREFQWKMMYCRGLRGSHIFDTFASHIIHKIIRSSSLLIWSCEIYFTFIIHQSSGSIAFHAVEFWTLKMESFSTRMSRLLCLLARSLTLLI